MNLFFLKKLADKTLTFKGVSARVSQSDVKVMCSDNIIEEIMNSSSITQEEKGYLVFDIELD